jgi:hypothetical protein
MRYHCAPAACLELAEGEMMRGVSKSHQLAKSMRGEFWTPDAPAAKFLMSFAPPGGSFAPPPGRNSDNFDPLPRVNR